MKARSVTHSTFVLERPYPAAPERVFSAFSDPVKKRRWFAEGENMEIEEFETDFRVGGIERARFRSKDGLSFRNDTVYQDIQPNRRIVFAYTMSTGERPFSASLGTFEFLPTDEGTALIFTEQGAFFEGADGPQLREAGWRQLLEELAKEMTR